MLLTNIPMDHPMFAEGRWHDARWQHRQVMRLFGDLGDNSQARSRGAVLFRVEPDVAGGRVLIQSSVPPIQSGLRTTGLGAVLERYAAGQRAQLLLTANTVRTINRTGLDGTTRTHRARVPESQLGSWLKDRLHSAIELHDTISITPGVRRQGKAQLICTTFRATGTVTDPDRLRSLCIEGIGRAKAYGCGLLTALPLT
ncbi:MAG: type I-E CRISPR-associated protein Cas6/Cse3/CasE [Acidimicrobiia bacterium]